MRTLAVIVTAAMILLATANQFAAALPKLQPYDSGVFSHMASLGPPDTAWIVVCRERWRAISR